MHDRRAVNDATEGEPPFEHSATVRQAAQIVASEMNCRVEDALLLMRAGAKIANVSVDEVAAAVIDGSFQFADPANDEGQPGRG